MKVVDPKDAFQYEWCIKSQLSESAQSCLEEIRYGIGMARGAARAFLTLLGTYEFVVDDTLRKRITTCRDCEQILTVVERLPSAQALDDVFT